MSVGVDLALVSDVRASVSTFGERYLRRIFTEQELADCYSSLDPIPRLAARFAAKEATIKALRVDGPQPNWTSMEVVRDVAGWCDEMRLRGSAADLAAKRGIGRLLVSLSHEQDAAVAVVVATKPAQVQLPAVPGAISRGCAAGPWARPLRIGFVNNMPDAAFEETYRQFAALLQSAPGPVSITCYSIRSVSRAIDVSRTADVAYVDHHEVYRDNPDVLVVTGTEPVARDLRSEPYWDDLSRLLVWAEQSVTTVLLSCLASHAAVLALDGICRQPLTLKRSGVYRQTAQPGHPLVRGLTEPVNLPHSRMNGVSRTRLLEHGYQIALQTEGVADEWTVATRERAGRLLVLLQGHPEYARTALLKEYRRDVRRYIDGARHTLPNVPDGYFDEVGTALLIAFSDRCLRGRVRADDFPYDVAAEHIAASWDQQSSQLFGNWLRDARLRAGLTVR